MKKTIKLSNKELLYPAGKISNIRDMDLAQIIREVKVFGIPEKYWNRLSVDTEHDWSGCYYPDDTPSTIVSLEWGDIYEL